MSCSPRAFAVLVTALAVTASGVPASARSVASGAIRAERWGPVKILAPNPAAVSVVVDGRGTTTVVWATSTSPSSVVAKQRPAGGPWGRRVVLGRGTDPQLVGDRRGNVTVVWVTERPGRSDGVAAARRNAGGTWTAAVSLSRDVSIPGHMPGDSLGYGAADPDVAVNTRGAVVATWSWTPGPGVATRIQSAYRPTTGAWRAAVDVTPPSGTGQPEVGLARDGTALVVYGRQPMGAPQALLARRRGIGGTWSKPTIVTAEGYSHDVALDGTGNALTVFTPDFSAVDVASAAAGQRWRAPRTLAGASAEVNDFALALNPGGSALVAMSGGSGWVDVVDRRPGGGWSPRTRLTGPRVPVSEVVCVLDRAGDAFVGWGTYGVYGAYRPSGGSWSKRRTISPDAGVEVLESAVAAIGPGGDVAVVWDQEARPLKARLMSAS